MLCVEHEIEHETYKTWASTGPFNFITSGPGDDDLSIRLKKTKKPTQSRLRFDLDRLRNPDVAGKFQATIGGKLAPLINLRDLLYCCFTFTVNI